MKRSLFVLLVLAATGCRTTSPTSTGSSTTTSTRDPDELVQLEGDRIVVQERLQFEKGVAALSPRSKELLGAVAKLLKRTSAVTLLRVEGYADASGESDQNLPLSQLRADVVRDYLIAQGIDAGRLVAKGFGTENPVAENDTEAGRAQNRRVEFHVLK
jgi:outer membrane protein OmpA-like peptidoglycan-associated protein